MMHGTTNIIFNKFYCRQRQIFKKTFYFAMKPLQIHFYRSIEISVQIIGEHVTFL